MGPVLPCLDNSHSSLAMIHLYLLFFQVGEKFKISHCAESNFISTITLPSLPSSKLSLSARKGRGKLISESVAVEDEDSGRVLEELLLLWMITSQYFFLVP